MRIGNLLGARRGAGAALVLVVSACAPDDVAPAPPSASPRALGLVAASVAAQDPDAAIALAAAALRDSDAPETRTRLVESLAARETPDAFREHQETVTAAGFLPRGDLLVTASRDGSVRSWDLAGDPSRLITRHAAAVYVVRFLAPGDAVLTAGADATARISSVDGSGGEPVVLRGHADRIVEAECCADGSRVLTVSLDRTARLWDRAGRTLATLGPPGPAVHAAHLSPDGRHVVTLSERLVARTWTSSGQEVATLREGDETVERAQFSPDGELILTDAPDGTLRLWSPDGTLEARLEGHTAPLLAAAFSPDGRRLVTGALDSTARVWDVPTGSELAVLHGHQGAVFDVAVATDGQRLLTVSSDSTARLWDGDGELVATLGGPKHPVALGVLAPTGDSILTASRDHGTARVWDRTGALRGLLRGHGRSIRSASFSPDGARVLTVSSDLTVRVWPIARDLLLEASRVPPNGADAASPSIDPPPAFPLDDRDAPDARPDLPARGDYADPAECAPCHRREYDLWAASAHARTFEPATVANMPADVTESRQIAHPPGSTTFRNDDGHLFATTLDTDGNEYPFHLSHVAGRQRIRMFVATLPDGRMQVLPGMLEVPTGAWFDYTHLLFGGRQAVYEEPPVVAPGDASFWTGAVRSWTARCARCHSSGNESRHPGLDGRGARSGWRSLGVDCDACHGPGRAHAEAWRRMETRAPLQRLERLPLRDRTANCISCHTEGEIVQREFGTGSDLFEHLDPTLLLSPDRADATGRALELIYDGLPLATSACAQGGGLTCARCHDPHGGANPSALRAPRSRALCEPCHADLVGNVGAHAHHDAGGSGGDCLACHMPFLTIERGHGAVADHTIGIPYPGFTADRVAVDACTWCHTGGLAAPPGVVTLTAERVAAAYTAWWPDARGPRPWMLAIAAARREDPGAGTALVAIADDETVPRLVRASAIRLLDGYAAGHRTELLRLSRHADSVLRRSAAAALAASTGAEVDARLLELLDDPSPAVRRAAAHAALAGWSRVRANAALLAAVLPVLEADVGVVPDDHLRWFRLGAARSLSGDDAGALDAYEHQLAIDPLAGAVRRQVERLRARVSADRPR